MRDRAMQALYLLSLDPLAETLADPNSYGFRTHRAPADAIEQCCIVLAKKASPQWLLEGDIRACFGAPGQARCFQRVQFPPRQEASHLTGNRVLGS
jgi:hypothetical protein